MANKIGFTDIKEDTIKKVREDIPVTLRNSTGKSLMIIGGILLSITLTGKFVTAWVGDSTPKEAVKVETVSEKTVQEKPKEVVTPKQEQPTQKYIVGDEAVKLHGDQLMSFFNGEIESSEYNVYFKGNFSIVDSKTLNMSVDIGNASKLMNTSEYNTRKGIQMGADSYRSYLKRFDNRIWNGKGENLSLQIVDEHGTLITEVTN
ncbi:hypothetical protein PSYJYH_000026 [Bacillus phage PSYJ-YH]|nr:hypothetical protein PSYJYH_000026 [Bacillus phage PSYJ-YH]